MSSVPSAVLPSFRHPAYRSLHPAPPHKHNPLLARFDSPVASPSLLPTLGLGVLQPQVVLLESPGFSKPPPNKVTRGAFTTQIKFYLRSERPSFLAYANTKQNRAEADGTGSGCESGVVGT